MIQGSQEVRPLELLARSSNIPDNVTHHKAALIVLNQPIADLALLARIWENTEYRVCADGGANRLYELFSGKDSGQRDLYVRGTVKRP